MTAATTRPPGLQGSRRGRAADPVFRWAMTACGAGVLLVLAWMITSTTTDALPILRQEGLDLFFSADWDPGSSRDPGNIEGSYGGLEFFFGTVVSSVLAMVFAVPLAVGIALYLTQLAPERIRRPLTYTVDLLAAVPSVIYGLWGSLFLVPILLPMMNWVLETFGFLPFLGDRVTVRNLFVASLVLGIMILPITSAVVREVMATVPRDERWAAYGLGATRWEVMRGVVLPRARAGIVGGSMLGLGRALGETIAVLLIIGGNPRLTLALFDTQQTVAAQIASGFAEASPEHIRGLIALGVGLFVITIGINVIARAVVRHFGQVTGDASL
jgi:phosphate transport system permease protein